MEFPRKREPPARAACPLKANVLIEVRYHHPLGGLSTPSLVLAWKVETATLPGLAAGTWHAGVGPGEDTSLARGGEMLYPNYRGHPAQQLALVQEVCVIRSSYPVTAPVPAQRLHSCALSCHME